MNHPFCSGKSLMLMGALALMIVMGSFVDSSALGRRQLHCSAGKILDENNATVILRGFGLGNWLMTEGYMWKITSKSYDAPREMEAGVLDLVGQDTATATQFWKLFHDNYTTEKDFCAMKAWGCNSVRISFNANLIQPRSGQPASAPYNYDPEGWRILDNIVAWCTKYQIWLIWDMHGAPGGQSKDNIADADGIAARLWTEPTIYQPRAIDLWMKIAQRYVNNDWVVGYNILNEPILKYDGLDQGLYRPFLTKCTDSLRKIDSKGILFIDGDSYAQDFTTLTPPWDPQIVYSFHCYPACCSYFGLEAFATQYGTPMWHGETGEGGATDPYTSYTNCVTKLETHNPPVGWAWWTLKKFSNTTMPYSITMTPGFQAIINYWNGTGAKPTVANAKAALLDMALKTNTDSTRNVSFLTTMVSSLKLDPSKVCTVPVEYQESVKPMGFAISQNAVSHASVAISFTLPYSYPVTLNIYDMSGKLQKSLINRAMSAGKQVVSWDRTNMDGKKVVNGVYVYKFTMGDKMLSHHFVLAK